jgi:hypothetical protein
VTAALQLARRCWALFEPIHAVTYFAAEPADEYRRAGLRGSWMSYFAARSAPMGAVGPEAVIATFFIFHASLVRRALPDAWRFASPERVLEARLAGVDATLRRLWGGRVGSSETREAADLALRVTLTAERSGHPIFAGNAALAVPEAAHLALWHACTLLREHRFDGHAAALTVHGLDGCEALVSAAVAGGLDPELVSGFRGWPLDQWRAAEGRLRQRGLLTEAGRLTAAGRSQHEAIEATTDELATVPWKALDDHETERLLALLRPLARALRGPGGITYPDLLGIPDPA